MDNFFLTVNSWMAGGTAIAALGCFLWGIVSVLFSPCHLASIPLIVGYVGGQKELVKGKKAALYAVLFTTGLFITIALIGVICALMGRMLGDVGSYWTVLVGFVLIWVALDMFGVSGCSISGGLMSKLKVKGKSGSFILGLAYGVLSGSCTFGFIAPILAIITVQNQVLIGVLYIVLFGIGHCIPIAIAGGSAALVQKILLNQSWQRGGILFRRLAGILIASMGVYFVIQPFVN
ncbi:cytochrome c biogenesis CcdA family protein [Desulfovibrio sp. UCD-KL4C]|uniref:cytochrome c biogenesis CcdA family protein n=1 Tax=Desulfovibrio sp. UCD-KL4C TaxID=2578120 RepID=UPI0025BC3632|nr:cytochrome c biogenesis protein CcdA [Desulfovibrio sp. UCD-KL4C]